MSGEITGKIDCARGVPFCDVVRKKDLKKKDYFYKEIDNAMNSTISSLQLFQILRQKIGEKEAEALVDFVDYKIKENNESNLKILATKEDIHLLKEDIIRVEGKLENKISETKSDIIKWVFSFFFALALLILGLYLRR